MIRPRILLVAVLSFGGLPAVELVTTEDLRRSSDAVLLAQEELAEKAIKIFQLATGPERYNLSLKVLRNNDLISNSVIERIMRNSGAEAYYSSANGGNLKLDLLALIAGERGMKEVLRSYYDPKQSPNSVVYGYAMARGYKLYYAITESAGIDAIVQRAECIAIIEALDRADELEIDPHTIED